LLRCRAYSRASCAPLAHAVRCCGLRRRGVDDAGSFHIQNGTWTLVQLASGSQGNGELMSVTVSDGMTAVTIILAMSFGLILPKMVVDHVSKSRLKTRS
jgi:hypothetical protein